MRKCLVDSGPLIALFDRSERQHEHVKTVLKKNRFQLVSTWLLFAEVGHMLSFDVRAQLNFVDWVLRGGVTFFDLGSSDLQLMRTLAEKYGDVPLDFADGSLIVAAEALDLQRIMTFDSDFYVYRIGSKKAFNFVI